MLAGYWNNGVGCSIETLAELMGDTPKTAFDHYGREWGRSLSTAERRRVAAGTLFDMRLQWGQHYREPLWAALGAG
jgi:hypothetical protein